MKTLKLPLLGVCLMLCLSTGQLHAEPLLNGLAINTEFGKERFIAALYSDRLTDDATTLLADAGNRRMEIKIVADSISARSINSLWIEGMAINNPGSALEAEAQNLAKLSNMIRKRLRAGDILAFDAAPGNGTAVTLNGVKLGTINSDDFFPMLLRTWIGSIPLSSSFKDALLANGDVDSELFERYSRIEPSDARVDTVAAWVAPEPPQPKIVESSGPQPPKPEPVVIPPPAPTGSSLASAATNSTPTVADGDTQTAQASQAVAKPAKPKAQSKVSEPAAPARIAKSTPTPTPKATEEEEERDEDVEEDGLVTAESLILRQRYISDVMRQTLQNVRYPRRAVDRNQQGNIRLEVTVERNGEVQKVRIVEESPFSALNREAVASIERSSPFPKVPESVGGETFSFGIPVVFRLQ